MSLSKGPSAKRRVSMSLSQHMLSIANNKEASAARHGVSPIVNRRLNARSLWTSKQTALVVVNTVSQILFCFYRRIEYLFPCGNVKSAFELHVGNTGFIGESVSQECKSSKI